jgi:hypothetical protein
MRVLGAGASVLLVGALILAGIGLFGGPDTPFSVFRAPIANRGQGGPDGGAGHSASGQRVPGAADGSQPPGSPTSPASPSHSAAPSSPAPSTSATPTNSAGKTPPGLSRSRKPHPSPSPHAT